MGKFGRMRCTRDWLTQTHDSSLRQARSKPGAAQARTQAHFRAFKFSGAAQTTETATRTMELGNLC
jgi:hypothetical protein